MNISARRKLEIGITAYLKRFQGTGEALENVVITDTKSLVESESRIVVFVSKDEPEVEGHYEAGIHTADLKIMVLNQADAVEADDSDNQAAAVEGILWQEDAIKTFLNVGSVDRPVNDFKLTRLAYTGSEAITDQRSWGEELTFHAVFCDYD